MIIVGFLAFYRMDSFLRSSFLLIRIAKISIFFFQVSFILLPNQNCKKLFLLFSPVSILLDCDTAWLMQIKLCHWHIYFCSSSTVFCYSSFISISMNLDFATLFPYNDGFPLVLLLKIEAWKMNWDPFIFPFYHVWIQHSMWIFNVFYCMWLYKYSIS